MDTKQARLTQCNIEDVKRLGEVFVAKVRNIQEVKKVLLVDSGDYPRIWTVLDGKPFDRVVENLVYQAEGEVLRLSSRPLADFRLINLAEFEDEDRPHLLPTPAKFLYERP